jgi:hypothetical protein
VGGVLPVLFSNGVMVVKNGMNEMIDHVLVIYMT